MTQLSPASSEEVAEMVRETPRVLPIGARTKPRLSQVDGWPTLHPDQDGSDYFNYHHTPNDTLDKVDPAAMRANAAAWAVIAWLAAQADVDFGPLPRDPGQ